MPKAIFTVCCEGHEKAAWMIVSPGKKEAIVYYFRILAHANQPFTWLKLQGIEDTEEYYVKELRRTYTGAELTCIGLPVSNFSKDFQTEVFHLVRRDLGG